jgi:hypothetical protein
VKLTPPEINPNLDVFGLQIRVKADYIRHSGFHRRFAMSGMNDRGDAFEKKFAHDEALQFKAEARRNKLLGMWAAGLLGKSGEDAAEYAKEVIRSDFEEAGDEDVFRKVRADFDVAGIDQSDHQLRRTMDEFMAQAIEQIKNES